MLVALALAAAAVAVTAIAVAATRGGGGSGEVAKKLAAASCSFKTYPDQGRAHVQSVDAKVNYNPIDKVSVFGRYSISPTNIFDPQALGQAGGPAIDGGQPGTAPGEVHNLEHGGVIVQYGSKVPASTVTQLQSFYDSSPNGMLLSPLPKLGDKIALTAWTHLATCGRFDESAVRAFRDAYRGKGPEHFPISALTPGS